MAHPTQRFMFLPNNDISRYYYTRYTIYIIHTQHTYNVRVHNNNIIYNILSVTRQLTLLFSKTSSYLIFLYLLLDLQANSCLFAILESRNHY